MHAATKCLALLSLLVAATAFAPLSSVLLIRARRPLAVTGFRSLRAQENSIGEESQTSVGAPVAAAKQGAVGVRVADVSDIKERMPMLARQDPHPNIELLFAHAGIYGPLLAAGTMAGLTPWLAAVSRRRRTRP